MIYVINREIFDLAARTRNKHKILENRSKAHCQKNKLATP